MATEASTARDTTQRQWRVILAGRTGLDAELRFDPRIELIRVRSSVDAIGELSDPIDDASPVSAVVVVGPDVDPGAMGSNAAVDFVDALRRVDPSVRVMRAAPRFAPPPASLDRNPYDADVEHGSAIATIEGSATGSGAAPDRPAETDVQEIPEAPDAPEAPPASPVVPGVESPATPGDASVVKLLLVGRDPTLQAVQLVRERTGISDLRFVARDHAMEVPREHPGEPVVRHGTLLGWLISDEHADADLSTHATWLADWIVLRDQQRQLRAAAMTDPLTGAWNRRYLDRFLSRAIDRAKVHRRPLTVLVFDIDDFKTFNDEFSHAAGDEILIHTVKLLRSVIRPTDKVCRIGGDEFVVVFHEPDGPRDPSSVPPSSVFQIARRFQRQICEHRFPKLGDQAPGTLTISGGLATYPWDGRSSEELIAAADELSMQSKRQGKNALTLGPGAARICDTDMDG